MLSVCHPVQFHSTLLTLPIHEAVAGTAQKNKAHCTRKKPTVTYQQPSWVLREKSKANLFGTRVGEIICKPLSLLVKRSASRTSSATNSSCSTCRCRGQAGFGFHPSGSFILKENHLFSFLSIKPFQKNNLYQMYFLQKQHKACSVNPNNMLIKICCYAAMKVLLGNGCKKGGTVRSRTSN